MTLTDVAAGRCGGCGHPQSDPAETVSTHATSEGLVTYTRCGCGALQIRLARWDSSPPRVVAEGRPAPGQW